MDTTRRNIFLSTALELVNAGFCPVILNGKKPIFSNWPEYMPGWASHEDVGMRQGSVPPFTAALLESWSRDYPNANVGVNCREAPTIDLDDPEILPFIWDLLPRTPHRKRGARGYSLMYAKHAADPVTRSRTFPSRIDGHMLVEILSDGRQTVLPPSVHPETGQPYVWEPTPWGDPATPLGAGPVPTLSQTQVDAIETRLRDHGLVGVKQARGAALTRGIADAERPRYAAFLQPKVVERLEILRSTERGGRQDALNGAVVALAPWIREGFLTEDWLEDQTHAACEDNGYIRDDGEKAWRRQFDRALEFGWTRELPDLDGDAAARMGPAPQMPSWMGQPAGVGGSADAVGTPVAEPLPPFEAVSLWDELDQPEEPQEWTVEGWLPHEEVTSYYGQGGIGKSTALLQMGVAIATGRPWMGKNTTKRRVLYVSGEDKRSDMVRMVRGAAQGIPRDELANAVFMVQSFRQIASDVYPALGKQNRQDGETVMTALFGQLVAFVKANQIGALFLDPVGMLYLGNQNDLSGVYSFLNSLCRSICDLGVTVVLSAHPSKSGRREGGDGTSGSVGWDSAPRAVVTMRRPNEEDRAYCTITLTKANRGPAGEVLHARWTPLGFVAVNAPGIQDVRDTDTPACRVFLEILRRRIDNGLFTTPSRAVSEFARHDLAISERLTKDQLTTAKSRLEDAKIIETIPYGKASDGKTTIVIINQE